MHFERVDYASYFSQNIYLFKLMGFWKPDKNSKFGFLYKTYTAICITLWVLFLASQLKQTYEAINDVDEFTSSMQIAGTCLMVHLRIIALYIKMDLVKKLIVKLQHPLFQVRSEEQWKQAKTLQKSNNFLFRLCLFFGLQSYVGFTLLAFFRKERKAMTNGWFPFDWTVSPYYEMVFVFQNVACLWNALSFVNMQTLSTGLLMFAGLQCDCLSLALRGMGKAKLGKNELKIMESNTLLCFTDVSYRRNFSRKMCEELIVCIEHYKIIKGLMRDIQDIMAAMTLIMFVAGSIIICSGLFQLSVVERGSLEFMNFFTYILTMLIDQFLCCWFASTVEQKSIKVFESTYSTPWVECDSYFRKILLQFMTQTQTPLTLKAGSLFVISVTVFVSIVRTSYSYFALLQSFQQ